MERNLIVQKFGGTSVATVELISNVADRIVQQRKQGYDVVVVVSAMGETTDKLLAMAKSVMLEPLPTELDALLSTGEQISASLLAMELMKRTIKARSFSGWQAGIHTDFQHTKARISDIDPRPLQAALATGQIPVITGFQGCSPDARISTLGRGGSDTTAVAISVALKAYECDIYTDVDGVYTADPRVVKKARLLRSITNEEMLELTSLGARVLHPRAVKFAGHYNVQLRVRSSFKQDKGTLITLNDEDLEMEDAIVSGVTVDPDEAKITVQGVEDRPGIASKILGPIAAANINVDMIVQNTAANGRTDFTFTVQRESYQTAMDIINARMDDIGGSKVTGNDRIAKVSAVGIGMRSHAGVSSRAFKALADENINILMISTSEIKISVVIDEKYIELAQRTLHKVLCED